MNISMYNHMIAVTNRHLCKKDFLEQIRYLASTDIDGIVLREKDLPEQEYEVLAKKVWDICQKFDKKCILHTYIDVARRIGCANIHLPMSVLMKKQDCLKDFKEVGTSVHSVEDAIQAQKLGIKYMFAGHIFDTDCKKGLPGRGLTFLQSVCEVSQVPVYGIGGVTPENLDQVMEAGAAGGCMMSLSMRI